MDELERLLDKSMDILGQIALEEDFFKRMRPILSLKETILDMKMIVYKEKSTRSVKNDDNLRD